jgi:SAM-dependent methyltransferase
MFFKDRIKNIIPSDVVLEIGPGATPHPRSNVLLEKIYSSEEDFNAQTGYNGKLVTNKQIIYYDGSTFPFNDKEFDYVICSHVLEHVDDVNFFLKEIFRVGKKGYLEYPTVYYDYIYNFPVHKTFLLKKDDVIYWMSKEQTPLSYFAPVQDFLYYSLEKRYYSLVNDLVEYFFQGFEWEGYIKSVKVFDLKDVCFEKDFFVSLSENRPINNNITLTIRQKIKNKLKRLIDYCI